MTDDQLLALGVAGELILRRNQLNEAIKAGAVYLHTSGGCYVAERAIISNPNGYYAVFVKTTDGGFFSGAMSWALSLHPAGRIGKGELQGPSFDSAKQAFIADYKRRYRDTSLELDLDALLTQHFSQFGHSPLRRLKAGDAIPKDSVVLILEHGKWRIWRPLVEVVADGNAVGYDLGVPEGWLDH